MLVARRPRSIETEATMGRAIWRADNDLVILTPSTAESVSQAG
jgi:hypothetical protein